MRQLAWVGGISSALVAAVILVAAAIDHYGMPWQLGTGHSVAVITTTPTSVFASTDSGFVVTGQAAPTTIATTSTTRPYLALRLAEADGDQLLTEADLADDTAAP